MQACVNDLRRSFKMLTVLEHDEVAGKFDPTNRMRVCKQTALEMKMMDLTATKTDVVQDTKTDND